MCEETLAAHKSRLGELKGLVAQIENDVGLEAGGLLEAEVDALGKPLEDVRETLATLAEVAETKAASRDLCTDDLLRTKTYLSSVQQVSAWLMSGIAWYVVSCTPPGRWRSAVRDLREIR